MTTGWNGGPWALPRASHPPVTRDARRGGDGPCALDRTLRLEPTSFDESHCLRATFVSHNLRKPRFGSSHEAGQRSLTQSAPPPVRANSVTNAASDHVAIVPHDTDTSRFIRRSVRANPCLSDLLPSSAVPSDARLVLVPSRDGGIHSKHCLSVSTSAPGPAVGQPPRRRTSTRGWLSGS